MQRATPGSYPGAFRFSSCHCDPVLDTGVGNLVAVAMMVPRSVLNLHEIATWFDRLTMNGYAPRNDNRMALGFVPGNGACLLVC